MLTNDQIEFFAKGKGVKKIAVENFLSSLEGLTFAQANANLQLDAKLYKWNMATKKAIQKGIRLFFKS